MFPEWTWIVGFWIGAAIGSFLNVVIYRLPRGLSIGQPTYSFCPSCKNRLQFFPDMVPLLSWLFLRGKCRQCHSKVPSRYFFVELVNGILWAAIWHQQMIAGEDWLKALIYSMFASALVAAIYTDLAHYIIPDQINAFLFFCGILMNIGLAVMGRPEAWMYGLPSSMVGALAGIAVLWGIAFLGRIAFGKDAMGHGDIKMARGIGAVLLPVGAFTSFGLAIFLGAVFGVLTVLLRKKSPEPSRPNGLEGNSESSPDSQPVDQDEEEDFPPESIGSLLWCGLGYVLLIDVWGLAWPKLYERWFGENPYSVEEIEDDPEVELTMIPFGPYLAAGALGVVLFGAQLLSVIQAYWKSVSG